MLNEIDRPLHEFVPPPEPVKGKKSYKKILPALLAAVLLTCITVAVDSSEYIEPPPIINGDHGISVRFAAFSSAAEIVVDIEEPERVEELSCKIVDRYRYDFLLDEGLGPDKKQLATGEFHTYVPLWQYVEAVEEAFGPLDDEGIRHLEVIVEARFKGESVKWPVATAPLLFADHDLWPRFENGKLVIELMSHGPLEGVTTDLSKVTKTVVGLQIDGIEFDLSQAEIDLGNQSITDYRPAQIILHEAIPQDKPFDICVHTIAADVNDEDVPWAWRVTYDPDTGFFN